MQKLQEGVRLVRFTTGYVWVVTDKKEVVQYPIVKDFD